jgi:1-deoxy-D-xylulose-5-phosphate reductoisomerase
MKKRVAVLGATGSIGKSTVDVLRRHTDAFEVVLLSSHSNSNELVALSAEFPKALLALSGQECSEKTKGIRYVGLQGLLEAIAVCGADIAVNGIAGAAGLEPSLAVLNAGMDLALANKETMVMAGPLVFALAKERQVRILPVDSEHAAIFTLLEAQGKERVEEILLTASGGPFRTYTQDQLAMVRPQDALKHPTWNMGAKITIDSATLANKGLEVIEAVRLFAMAPEHITVVVHPHSIVHSMIRLKDGSVYAQLSHPDMRLPIQHALYYPHDASSPMSTLNFDSLTLGFEKPDVQKFPMLPLAYQAICAGDPYPLVYNAANEIAVAAFLTERIGFLDIHLLVKDVLAQDWSISDTLDLGSILEIASRVRRTAETCLKAY